MSDLSQSLVAAIAKALNSNQIPCILWGHFLLNVHGVPSIIDSIDFVIPDEDLWAGTRALTHVKDLTPCPDSEACLTSSEERYTPPPAFHVHIEDSECTVGLYLQSQTLWFLPPLDSSLLSQNKIELPSHFVLASDKAILPAWRPGRGSGVFQSERDGVVVVPRSHVLLEAFMRLYVRNSGKRIGSFSMAMIDYIELYVDEDGLLDVNQLPEPLRTFYNELKQGTKPVRQWTKELKEPQGIFEDLEDD